MRESTSIMLAAYVAVATCVGYVLAQDDIGTFDPDMEIPGVVTNGVKWIDGRLLPIEGRAFDGTENYYDRLPTNVTASVNSNAYAGIHVVVKIKSMSCRKVDGVGHSLVEHMPSVAVFDETLVTVRNTALFLIILSEHAHCHEYGDD